MSATNCLPYQIPCPTQETWYPQFLLPSSILELTSLFSLIEEAKHLASNLLSTGLLVVHDTRSGGEHDVSKLTRGKKAANPVLDVAVGDVIAGADDTALVEASVKLNDDLAGAVVVDQLELTNVTVLHHHLKELDDDLGDG